MDTIALLERLVAFDTTSRNPNEPLVAFIEQYLAEHDVRSRRVEGTSAGKVSLVARIGPDEPGGLVLCGHLDTVPVEGQPWTSDPFVLTEDGDRLTARGVVDMKGFVAAALAAVPSWLERDLQRPITLAWTHDEEIGCLSAPAMAQALRDEPRPAAVLVGEPTAMGLVRGHKGVRILRVTVSGKDAHSAQPQLGANANLAAGRLIARIADLAEELEREGVRDARFTPPWTTVNVGLMQGGQAMNIVPREASFTFSFRVVPGQDPDEVEQRIRDHATEVVLPTLQHTHGASAITFETIADTPVLDPSGNEAAGALIRAISGAHDVDPVAFGTDGSALQEAGFPTVVLGPGQLDQMHQPDEWIGRDELAACDQLLQRVGDWAADS